MRGLITSPPAQNRHTELAWAAGFFEGEGSIVAKRANGRVYLRAAVTQNGGDQARSMLCRFVKAVGLGRVLGPYDYAGRNGLGKKPRNVVAIQAQDEVDLLMARLDPYLSPGSEKREKYLALKKEQRHANSLKAQAK